MAWKIAVAVKRFLVIFFKADSFSKNTFKHKCCNVLPYLTGFIRHYSKASAV